MDDIVNNNIVHSYDRLPLMRKTETRNCFLYRELKRYDELSPKKYEKEKKYEFISK